MVLSRRVRGTRLWFPVTVLFGAVALFGGTGSIGHVADVQGDPVLASQLTTIQGMSIGLSIPALFQFVTSYPRALGHARLKQLIAVLYFLGITLAVLTPTRLVVETPGIGGAPPVYGPLFAPLTLTLTASLVAGAA